MTGAECREYMCFKHCPPYMFILYQEWFVIYFRSTANDEMCNFYIMYYMNSTMEGRKGPDTCYKNQQRRVFLNYPADSDTPLPPNPALEGVAMAHHHHGMSGSNDDDMEGNKVDEPIVDTEHPLVDFHGDSGISDNSGNGIVRNGYVSRGKLPTSYGDSLLSDVYRNDDQGYRSKGQGYLGLDMRRPASYVMEDYPGFDDYYNDVIQQRSRNRLKRPIYDVYDGPNYDIGMSEFPKKAYSALSRNRNKIFNDKYDEYAASAISKSLNSVLEGDHSDIESGNGVAMVTQEQSHSGEGLHETDKALEGTSYRSNDVVISRLSFRAYIQTCRWHCCVFLLGYNVFVQCWPLVYFSYIIYKTDSSGMLLFVQILVS